MKTTNFANKFLLYINVETSHLSILNSNSSREFTHQGSRTTIYIWQMPYFLDFAIFFAI
jgi:hypothetical protein